MDRWEDSRDDALSVDDGQGSARITRRQALQGAAVAGAAVALGGAPAAGAEILKPAKIKRGGILLTDGGGLPGGAGQTYDPQGPQIGTGWALMNILYQTLARYKPGTYNAAPHLASGWESNKKGDQWTIHVRRGVEFHNGKTMTAKDVFYSLKREATKGVDKDVYKLVDLDRSKIMDKYTVRVQFTSPYGPFDDLLVTTWIVPDGQDAFGPDTEIGTGAFQLYGAKARGAKLIPNQAYDLVRFPHYWEHGLPYLDGISTRAFADGSTALNGLYSGQVDTVGAIPAEQVGQVTKNGFAVLNAKGAAYIPLIMNASKPPFNDARVRLAMKLIANRPLMVSNALGGLGVLGNDLMGLGDPDYIGHKIPQRVQDIEQAKSLLKQAGQSDLTVNLDSENGIGGELSSAIIFGQDAPKAGIKVNVINNPTNTYFSSKGPWLNNAFYQDYWPAGPFLTIANSTYKAYGEGNYNNPKFFKLLDQAFAQPNAKKRAEIEREAQLLLRDDGPHLIWGFYDELDAYNQKKFKGFVGGKTNGSFNQFDFRYVHQV